MIDECPICAADGASVPLAEHSHLKNGVWGMQPVPDDTEDFCAEWEGEILNIYWHEREFPQECEWCDADLHGNGIEVTEYLVEEPQDTAVICSRCISEKY